MISCKTATELHTEAREGALGGVLRLRYRMHMLICPSCKSYETGFSQAIDALKHLPVEPAPDSVKRAMLARLRARGV